MPSLSQAFESVRLSSVYSPIVWMCLSSPVQCVCVHALGACGLAGGSRFFPRSSSRWAVLLGKPDVDLIRTGWPLYCSSFLSNSESLLTTGLSTTMDRAARLEKEEETLFLLC